MKKQGQYTPSETQRREIAERKHVDFTELVNHAIRSTYRDPASVLLKPRPKK